MRRLISCCGCVAGDRGQHASVALRCRNCEGPCSLPRSSVRRAATSEVAVLAGGCFWGVQGVFQRVDGVTSAVSGCAGGAKNTAE